MSNTDAREPIIRFLRLAAILAVISSAGFVQAHPGSGIVVDSDGVIYFAYGPSNRIWKIDAERESSVVVETTFDDRFRVPHHLYLDSSGRLISSSDQAGVVVGIDRRTGEYAELLSAEHVSAEGIDADPAAIGAGGSPVMVNARGHVIAAIAGREVSSNLIVRVTPDRRMTILAGGAGQVGDGHGTDAGFRGLYGASFIHNAGGEIVFFDAGVRLCALNEDGYVRTIVDHSAPVESEKEEQEGKSRIQFAIGLVELKDRSIVAADWRGHRIWKITVNGDASVLCGTGEAGAADGAIADATFNHPAGIAVDSQGRLVVLEYPFVDGREAVRIRRINLETDVVETLATITSP